MALPSEPYPPAPPRGTRPANRRQLIITAAADLFSRKGYPHVAMTDIAAAVAIGPSALYRHFTGKQDLLTEVVHDAFQAIAAALSTVDGSDRRAVLRALASAAVAHRGLGALWQRESRHLQPVRREPLRAELIGLAQTLNGRLLTGRTDLSRRQRELLTWAAMGAVMSISFQRVKLPQEEYLDLLVDLAEQIIDTRLPVIGRSRGGYQQPRHAPASKRAELLAAAVDMFAERGYSTVGIEDIGAAAGMAGPSIYHHFASKVDILVAAMTHGAGELQAGMSAVLGESKDSTATLRDLLRSYVDYSMRHSSVVDLMITETTHLPEQQRDQVHQLQRDYLAEWVRLLRLIHDGLGYEHARVRVQAALNITNDVARTPYLRAQPGVEDALCAIGETILLVG